MRKIRSEEIRFDVVVNGNKAQRELYNLEKANRGLTEETKELRREKVRLERAGKKESADYKQTTKLLREKNATIRQNRSRMQELQKEIGVTGLTMGQLQSRARALRLQLRNMVPGSKQYIKLEGELKKVNTRLRELRMNARHTEGAFSRLAQGFNKYSTLILSLTAGMTGVIFSLQRFIDFDNKISDAQADVIKTTSMTRKEVDELTKSFSNLNTRTSQMDLLVIAKEGGRLGLAKEEIGEFVEYVNIATIALADGFTGGVEEVAPVLGKLKFLFEETKDQGVAEAYSGIGSALNELAKNGISTEKNIAAFATRTGALPEALKPSASAALALGAGFEEAGIKAEVGSRAWGIVLRQATTNTEKFAEVMGWTNEEVQNLLNEDPTEFMLQFGESLKGASATEIGEIFKYLGVNADAATKSIGALSANTDRFRKLMDISKVGMEEATSMLDEYEIKNNNLAATYEKIAKWMRGIFLSDTLVTWLEDSVNWFAKFIGAAEDADGRVTRFRRTLVLFIKILAVAISTVDSYNAGLRLTALFTNNAYRSTRAYIAVKKALVITQRLVNSSLLLGRAAFYALTGQITRARAAMVLFNRTASANPLGLLLAGIVAVYTAFRIIGKEVSRAKRIQNDLNEANITAEKNVASRTTMLKAWQSIAEDVNASEEARIGAIKEINKIVPDYNKNLDLSKKAMDKGRIAIDKYVASLKKQMQAEALRELLVEKQKEIREAEARDSDDIAWYRKVLIGLTTQGLSTERTEQVFEEVKNKKIRELNSEYEAFLKAIEELYKENPELMSGGDDDDDYTHRIGDPDKAERELKALNDKLYKTLQDQLAKENKLIEDSLEQQLDALRIAHADKIKQLKDNLEEGEELSEEQIAINESINKQILLSDEIFQRDKAAILQKAIADAISEEEKEFLRQKGIRETAHHEELATLGNNQEARKRAKKKYQDEELKREKEFMLSMLEKYKNILNESEFNKMSLDILSEEEKDEILERLEEVSNKIAKIRGGKDDEDDPEASTDPTYAEGVDILGFTVGQWEQTFENLETTEDKIQAISAAVQGMTNAWAMFNEFQNNKDRQRLNEFERHNETMRQQMDRRLEHGLISERQHHEGIKLLDEELAKQKAEFEYNAAKRQKEMAIAQIMQNTALGITSALTSIPPNLVLAGIIGGVGAAQLGVAMSTPLPARGYEKGLYPVQREQDGKIFNARYGGQSDSGEVDFPTVFMAGEEGKSKPEMIISGGHYKRFSPEIKSLLHSEINRVRGFEDGLYPQADTSSADYALLNAYIESGILANQELIEILKNGIEAKLVRNMKNASQIEEDLRRLNRIKEESIVN